MAVSRLLLLNAVAAFASPVVRLQVRQSENEGNSTLLPYSTPGDDPSLIRASDINIKQETFLYSPAQDAGPFAPAGALGLAYLAQDSAIVNSELEAQGMVSTKDQTAAKADVAKYNGLQTLDDYTRLYDGEWQSSSAPTSQASGILTNYTQDLLFSMERLSFSPYAVRRLSPLSDDPPFNVDEAIVRNITGQTLDELLEGGRLFYANHTIQSTLPANPPPQYGPACDAVFYICPTNGDFLPLAIRSTGVGNDLVYTPADRANDWLLAKMMFNLNDFFMAQFDHFARDHFVTNAVYGAAIRTLSDEHPVLAILKRISYGAFGIPPLALTLLTSQGGILDTFFSLSGKAANEYANVTYFNGEAGAVRRNYFIPELETRGLLNSPIGPELKSFPFYEDGLPIYNAIREFTGTFIASYYDSDAAITGDKELQAWVEEATTRAPIIDFPELNTRDDVAELLAEIGRLVSFSHHAVNLNQLITAGMTLPFHPTALYKPIPTSKGVQDVVSYLPPLEKSLGVTQVAANFARPLLAGTNRSMLHMFDDPVMLGRMNDATREANAVFKGKMEARSEVVRSRGFDAEGLSQGMPFVWQALDPGVMAWSLTI